MKEEDHSDLIAATHQADVNLARNEIRKAITEASNSWIPATAISDALFLEFIDTATKCTSSATLAEQLTEVAQKLSSARSQAH